MRPIVRGPLPEDDQGNPKMFASYSKARGDLIERMGEYCSYCEMELDASLAVEHVLPKSLNEDLALSWSNFLLACTNCNSTKGNKPVIIDDYFWPDRDNTFRAFIYEEGGRITVNEALTASEQDQAKRVIDLVGLNKLPSNDPAVPDRRWINRLQAWGMAKNSLSRLQVVPHDLFRETVVELALTKGFWSIWMTVFSNDPTMMKRFIDAFPGTCPDCFDPQGQPTARPNGRL